MSVTALLNRLIQLLALRAGEVAGRPAGDGALLPITTPPSTPTPAPTGEPTRKPTGTPATVVGADAVLPTAAPATTGMVTETNVLTVTTTPGPDEVAQATAAVSEATAAATASTTTTTDEATATTASLDLARIPESGPRPPFTISVSTMRVAADDTIKVTGTVRNDGSETYEGIKVWGTFYTQVVENPDEKVRQGPPDRPGEGDQDQAESAGSAEEVLRGYGPVEVACTSPYLEPGAECHFSLEIAWRDYRAYHLGATGEPVEYRQPAVVALSGIRVIRDATGYVRITGIAVNPNSCAVENTVVTGTLLDGSEQIVSEEIPV